MVWSWTTEDNSSIIYVSVLSEKVTKLVKIKSTCMYLFRYYSITIANILIFQQISTDEVYAEPCIV